MNRSASGVPGPISTRALIWTNHAKERLGDRRMSYRLVEQTLSDPDYAQNGKQAGTFEYGKQIGKKHVTAIVTKSQEGKILVVSCWIDPPELGTQDYRDKKYYSEYQRAGSIWRQLWIMLKQQIGV